MRAIRCEQYACWARCRCGWLGPRRHGNDAYRWAEADLADHRAGRHAARKRPGPVVRTRRRHGGQRGTPRSRATDHSLIGAEARQRDEHGFPIHCAPDMLCAACRAAEATEADEVLEAAAFDHALASDDRRDLRAKIAARRQRRTGDLAAIRGLTPYDPNPPAHRPPWRRESPSRAGRGR